MKKYSNSLKSNVSNKSSKFPFYKNFHPQQFEKRKSSAKTLDNNIKLCNNDSMISKNILNSKFKISQTLINIKDNKISLRPKDSGEFQKNIFISEIKNRPTKIENIESTLKKLIGKNSLNDYNNNSNFFIELKDCNNNEGLNTTIDQYNDIIKSIKESKRNESNIGSMINGSIKFKNKSTRKLFNYPYEAEKIFTLKDMNEILSNSFELEQQENNKNLIEIYSCIIAKKLDPKNPDKLQNNLCQELVDVPIPSSNNKKEFLQLLDSTSSEEYAQKKFNINSLKVTSTSFEIKSCYKNINLITKGEIIKNSRFKRFIENLIKRNAKKKFYVSEKFKSSLSRTSDKIKKGNKKKETLLKNQTDKPKISSFNNKVNLAKKNKSCTYVELENYD